MAFYTYFKTLYSDTTHIPELDAQTLPGENIRQTNENYSHDDLNCPITIVELEVALKKLSNGKSVAEDTISNEMLKNTTDNTRKVLLKLFNACLLTGSYPWNTSLITPIFKKGDRYNPDHYRAISIGSCMGKLFSSILLARIIDFRKVNCPDPPNQLGFCADAQTSDHVLTLRTLIEKYTRHENQKLFACFVDFRKAFNSVCRQALLYKIAKLGIGGSFFLTLKDMYENSSTKIKLIQKLSDKIDVLVGTKEEHPMSPKHFKIFLLDLSELLNVNAAQIVVNLANFPISHLIWADDLV